MRDPFDAEDEIYQGGAFNSSIPGGKCTGTIELTGAGLHFHSDKAEITLSTYDLQVKRGGASNRLVFFSSERQPEWSLYTDTSILKNRTLLDDPDVAAQIRGIRKSGRIGKLIVLGVLLTIVGLLYLAVSMKDSAIRSAARQVPVTPLFTARH